VVERGLLLASQLLLKRCTLLLMEAKAVMRCRTHAAVHEALVLAKYGCSIRDPLHVAHPARSQEHLEMVIKYTVWHTRAVRARRCWPLDSPDTIKLRPWIA
jgi:hypothetical protein